PQPHTHVFPYTTLFRSHHVRHIAAVFPIAQPSGRVDTHRADGAGDEMHATEQMHEQIAGHAGAIIAVIAPSEKAHGFKRHFGRAAQETIPVDGVGRSVGRNGILPCADSGITVPPGFHHIQLADGAAPVELLRFLIHNGTDALASHLYDAAGFLLGLNHALAIFDALYHGLLAVHVLTGIHGIDGDLGVPVIGCGDDDGVD